MYYLPTRFINSTYRYNVNQYYYTIRTSENCYTQYNITYCDCYDVYFNNDYLTTNAYTCNYNANVNIDYSNFSDNPVYKNNFDSSLIIFFIYAFFIIYIPYRIFSRLFGRWLKC